MKARLFFALFSLQWAAVGRIAAQVECPSIGITNDDVRSSARKGGFMVRVHDHRKSSKTDLFIRPVSGKNRYAMRDAFVISQGIGRYREHDAFSQKLNRVSLFDGSAYFLRSRGRSPRYRAHAGFDRQNYRQPIDTGRSAFGNISGRGSGGVTQGTDHFNQRRPRQRLHKREPQPFHFQRKPQRPHREPQMGLWGGTIGKRGKESPRQDTPLPKSEEKKGGGN